MRFLGYTMGDPSIPIPPPTPELMDEMGKFVEEATKAGVLLAGGGFGPLDEAIKVTLTDGKFTVLDGPFTEAKEVLGGYWMIDVKSREEAIAWAMKCPASSNEIIEIRRVQEMSDFSPEVQQAAAGFSELQAGSRG